MGDHYRTGHNAAMKSLLAALVFLFASFPAQAWNAAGHRLIAAIAWRQMSPEAQEAAVGLLVHHPDYGKWTAKGGEQPGYAAFVEASTWPDDIRKDPRFFEEKGLDTKEPFPGMPDTARHKSWHYVDLLADGTIREGELDRQLSRLIRSLKESSTPSGEKSYALPWVIHLIGDIHQPLHVGSRDDEGGNRFEIENPLNARQPFTNLHTWWDDLPGPPWLRGARLEQAVDNLLAAYPRAPRQGNVALWAKESRGISRERAYPSATGSLLPTITEDFQIQSRAIAERRVAEAGYRLGKLLDGIFNKVSRETE